ncbi:MAG: hypothetical protein OXG33_03485 [Chloroflexi bacterium]|nr:hypothetical protein [Chloroflexota bacterium]
MTGPAARTAGAAALGAVVSGVTGALLLHGALQGGRGLAPEVVLTGVTLAAMVALAAWRVPPPRRRRFAAVHLAALAPLAAVAAAQQLSWELNHSLTQVSELSWVLASALPLATAAAACRAGGPAAFVDAAFGGAAGVGAAALFQVAVVDADALDPLTPWRIDPWWVLVGWALGAAVASGAARLPPQPAARLSLGPAWRTLPLVAAWIMAVVAALPAAPRHELATSAGAQALAVTLAAALALAPVVVWWGERAAPNRPRDGLRPILRRVAPPVTTLTLLLIGGLQAASYIAVTMDDLGPFWSTADALARGHYPVWEDWLSLPGLPVLLLASFGLLGFTYPAALAPMFLANVLLPWLIYRAALAVGAGRAAAFAAAVGLVLLPPVQIASLGSAEPDPVFIAWLAGATWVFAHVLRTPRPRASLLVLGVLAAVLAGTRPEGLLYGGLLVLGALVGVRSRWAAGGALTAAALVAPLALFSLVQIGRAWPTHEREPALSNIVEHAGIVGGITWPEISRDVLLDDVRFPLLIAILLALAAVGAVAAARRHWAFAVLPLAVGVNVLVTLGIDAYAVRPHDPQEFVRHIAYPAPIVAVLTAAGATALGALAMQRGARVHAAARAAGLALAVYVAAGSLYVLGTPESYHHGRGGSLLPADIYVTATDLWTHPLDLPPSGGWDFLGFRRELFDWYRPFDLHSDSAGAAYQTLTGAVAAMGMVLLLAAGAQPTVARDRSDPASRSRDAAADP